MKIPYYLLKNSFNSSGQVRYIAKVKKPGILDQEDLIHAMLYKNTTLTRQDILGVLDLMRETIAEKILSGYSVHTDLFRAGVSIRGDFTSPADRFDKKRHQVCVNMKPSLDIQRNTAARAAVERVNKRDVQPTICTVENLDVEREGNSYAPGDLVEIRGYGLRREDGKSPVYLFSAAEEAVWKRDRLSLKVFRVYDRSVLCQLPENLSPGDYHLYVDSSIDENLPLASTDKPLRVENPSSRSQSE